VDARETWQALQARLTAARTAADAGDRTRAMAEITAALDIDPHFLAAHSLRDRILSADEQRRPLKPRPGAAPAVPPPPAPRPSAIPHAPTARVSTDGYAKFEQRAKRRRVDRRLDAARAALNAGRLRAAAYALDEVIELDPNLPELTTLTAQFDELRRQTATPPRGPRLVAAAVFVVTVLGASWLKESGMLISRPMIASSPLVEYRTPTVAVLPGAVVGTMGARESSTDVVAARDFTTIAAAPSAGPAEGRLDMAEAPTPAVVPVAMPALTPVPAAVAAPVPMPRPASVSDSPVVAPVSVSPPTIPPVAAAVESVDDRALVRQTLQRYRSAYEGLDAGSAQAVWPAVNQAALARAFNGLESQTLTFDACDVRVRGDAATATCRGSARYVPKIGNREPRVEPRIWNFTLRKDSGDWKIENARAER
jgi:hypothetical protein